MRKYFWVFIAIYLISFETTYSSDIIPEYTNLYTITGFSDNVFYKKVDLPQIYDKSTCYINEYVDKRKDFKLKINGSIQSLYSYASSLDPKSLFEDSSNHYSKCIFDQIKMSEPFFFFEYPGSFYEVNISLEKTHIYEAEYRCYRADGPLPDSYPDIRSITFVPIYQCPKGYTSVGFNDGCIKNESLLCPGDVLGRDLDIKIKQLPSFIKEQGHIGIAIFHLHPYEENAQYELINRGVKVVEMLGSPDPGLKISQFDDFKEKVQDGYWGAKYGTINKAQSMTMKQYNSVINLLNYILEDEVDYVWSWDYSVRHVEKAYIFNPYLKQGVVVDWDYPSKFRCDTFVKYLYEKGAGIELNLNRFFSPKDLFEYLIFQRDKASIINEESIYTTSCMGNFSDIKDNIKNRLHPRNYEDLYSLDSCMHSFNEYSAPENEKMQFLWGLYDFEEDSFSKGYLLDHLAKYKTLSMTQGIIDRFNTDYDFYEKLLNLLIENLRFSSMEEIYNLTDDDIENIKKTYDFLGISEDDIPKITKPKSKIRKLIKEKSRLKIHH